LNYTTNFAFLIPEYQINLTPDQRKRNNPGQRSALSLMMDLNGAFSNFPFQMRRVTLQARLNVAWQALKHPGEAQQHHRRVMVK
jgi:hypothetical protein